MLSSINAINIKNIASTIILGVFLLYGINNYFFERNFYFNEILSLIGFIFFLTKVIKIIDKKIHFYFFLNFLEKMWLMFLLLGICHLIFSWNIKTNLYYYLRNSVIVYSCFSFWIGYYLLENFKVFFYKIRYYFLAYSAIALCFQLFLWIDRYALSVFFPWFFINKKLTNIKKNILFIFYVVYAILYPSSTTPFVAAGLALILFSPNFKVFSAIFTLILVGFISFMVYFSPNMAKNKEGGDCCLYGNLAIVKDSHPVFAIDLNATWRTIVWYKAITEELPHHLLGKGFGTPMFAYNNNMLTTYYVGMHADYGKHKPEYETHVSGLHNTYLTLVLRLGMPYLLIFFATYFYIFRNFYKNKIVYGQQGQIPIFLGFFAISIIGLFNLSLESPIYASLYWVSMGFVAKVISQAHNEPNKNIKLPTSNNA